MKSSIKLTAAAVLTLAMTQAYAKPPTATNIRPIEDFVERQGTFCISLDGTDAVDGGYQNTIVDEDFVGVCSGSGLPPLLFVPPIANFVGFGDAEQGRLASIDYAGLADYWAQGAFDTTFAGKVIERPLADGRALVRVVLHTDNALTWVVDDPNVTNDFTGPLLFGNRAPEVVEESAEPALGSASVQLEFINTAPGADLPDLQQILFFPEPGQEVLTVKINNKAKGPLTELFGVEDGTPGLNTGTQVGLLGNPNCGDVDSPSAVADCFPAERINLRAIGR